MPWFKHRRNRNQRNLNVIIIVVILIFFFLTLNIQNWTYNIETKSAGNGKSLHVSQRTSTETKTFDIDNDVNEVIFVGSYPHDVGNNEHEDKLYIDDNNSEPKEQRLPITNEDNRLMYPFPIQAMIIGGKNCGSDVLHSYLRFHPDILSPEEEINFFDENKEKGWKWYRDQLEATKKGKIVLDFSTEYYASSTGPSQVFGVSPSIKLIMAIRNPTHRIIDEYSNMLINASKIPAVEKLIFMDVPDHVINISSALIRLGMYVTHLDRWFRYFPQVQVHVITYEDLVSKTVKTLKEIEKFLGINRFFEKKLKTAHHEKELPCLLLNKRSTFCVHINKDRGNGISNQTLRKLDDFYKPFNKKLSQVLKKPLRW